MKLVTQDGRTLKLSRDCHLMTWTIHSDPKKIKSLRITLEGEPTKVASKIRWYEDGKWHENPDFYWHHNVILDEVVGEYETETSRRKAADMLDEAWKSGASEFVMPQDTFEKSLAEQFDDFCEEHGLTLVSINELGYSPDDTARNLHIWKTTDEFERRGILVADDFGNYDDKEFGGAYAASFKKWQALQRKVVDINKGVRRYEGLPKLRQAVSVIGRAI